MLELFRKNNFINSLFLLPYIFIVRLNSMLHPVMYNIGNDENSIIKAIYQWMPNALVQNIIANIIIFIQALLIAYLCSKHRLSREITLFPSLFYILFVTLISENTLLSPILIANTFVILAIINLFETYKLPKATVYIFNAGFFIGAGSVIYPPYFAFIIFGIISLLVLRSFRILEKLQYFIGVCLPYFLVFTFKYWFDIKFADLEVFRNLFFQIPNFKWDSQIVFYISVGLLLLSTLISIFLYGTFMSKKSIESKKKIDILYWLMLFSFISFLVFRTNNTLHIISLALPLSLFIGMNLSDSRNKVWAEFIHIIFIALIFIDQFNLINF